MKYYGRMPLSESRRRKVRLIRASGKRCQGCEYPFKGHPEQLARVDGSIELDHKVPLVRGGTDAEPNLQVLCLPCHDGKTNQDGRWGLRRNMTDAEWRAAGRPQDWERKRRLMSPRR